jgi:DNA-binding transcriptional regulator YiaG
LTPEELKQARAALGLTGDDLAAALGVAGRTVRAWESGMRDGKPAPVPQAIAVLLRLALKMPTVRRELGIRPKAAAE